MEVTLDGSASSDPNLDVLTFSWTQTSGETVILSDPTSDSPTFTAPEVDSEQSIVLEFNLEVDDGNFHTDTDMVQITVNADDIPAPPEDSFTLDGELNPTVFTTSGDTLSVSITALGVDFDNLKILQVELKKSNKDGLIAET